jgi:gluconate 2-dehydrogenase gamma chain
MSDERRDNSRRNFLKSTLVAISTATLSAGVPPAIGEQTQVTAEQTTPKPLRFLKQSERAFLKAAVDRLIPRDEHGSGAVEAGVVEFIDQQMAGDWGRGKMLYRHGPFRKGTPMQGYQLEYTPAELFRRSIAAIGEHFSGQGTSFDQLTAEQKDAYLASLEKGESDLNGVPSNVFFEFLWKHTVEGFFADPIYGGNKNKVGWKYVGFPGAYADYYNLVDRHGLEFHREPVGIGEGAAHSMSGHQGRG